MFVAHPEGWSDAQWSQKGCAGRQPWELRWPACQCPSDAVVLRLGVSPPLGASMGWGAHVRPGTDQVGSTGSASSRSVQWTCGQQ